MKKDATEKTNVMRLLDQKKAVYKTHSYAGTETISGVDVAAVLGQDPARVFKTLVTLGKSGQHYVFVIPVAAGLDLKKAAKAVGEKSIAMIHVSEINALTGYVRGGCSPLGMKKQYRTCLDSSCLERESIVVSAGRIGAQVELAPQDLIKLTRAVTGAITKEP